MMNLAFEGRDFVDVTLAVAVNKESKTVSSGVMVLVIHAFTLRLRIVCRSI